MSPDSITLNHVIDAHLLLAVANGYYVADMLSRDLGSARDVAMTARIAFHEANVYRQLREWADTSQFARPADSITDKRKR